MAQSYYSYAPSATYSTGTYADSRYTTGSMQAGGLRENMYFSLNGKLIRSYKVRSFKVSPILDLWAASPLSILTHRFSIHGYREPRNMS